MIYTVTFNPAIDYVVQLPAPLLPGSLNRSTGEAAQFGGKGINVSRVLQQLGVPSRALGFIAGFTGQALHNGLEEMGIETDFVTLTQGMTRINVKVRGAEETEINGQGPVITREAMAQLYEKLDRLNAGDILVLSGSIPGCLGADTYEDLLSRLAGRDILTVVDAAGSLLMNVLKYRPFLIKPNHKELAEMFGQEAETTEQILGLAKRLQAMGARNVLVSRAGDGAVLLDEQGESHPIACPQGQPVNSVGAGDSMVAGFLAGWQERRDYNYALQLGTAAGSATAFSLDLATGRQIREIFAKMQEN